MIESINPATEEVLATFEELNADQVGGAISTTYQAWKEWSRSTVGERGRLLHIVASYLRENKQRFARLITLEMGKPIVEAEAEIEKCALTCDFYADNAERFLSEERVQTNAALSYVAFEPLGVLLAIMPWNFPFWQVFRFAAPALMAGNTVLLKHASNVPQCSLAIEEVFREGGLPEGAFRSLLVRGEVVEYIIKHPHVKAVSLTGSSATGAQVASLSGHALKKTVLELGGSDPFIVLADADLHASAAVAVRSRFQNAGQSCIAAKRFIVARDVAEEFEQLFAEEVSQLKVGDPLDRETSIGPMARSDLRDALDEQVRKSVQQGAKVLAGGERIGGRGYFYAPTVLTNVSAQMPVLAEETFGPAAAVIRVEDAEEAVKVANNTPFGLGANLWTRDIEGARNLARRIEAGSVFINGMVASDPRLPFGGVKQSGYGRELSEFGIREFVNVQTVWIGPAQGAQPPTPQAE
ncbi:MAG TPA: NAD-dependent succinate-semialdehyde dehydrogenase [Chloroflexia bacterium]|nr:NAD-dependent succinate-semialdehyde dehydrogenase [Chloroflexia bacterium]